MSETQPRILQIATSTSLAPWTVEWHRSIDSTMVRASELARAGASETVVVADFQSQGRGTRGRIWVAPRGTCLMFSVILRPSLSVAELAGLPVTIGRLLRCALVEQFGIGVEVDPPNDLIVNGRKLAGILCQSHLRSHDVAWVVCGVGVNTNLSEAQISIDGSTSLLLECGERVCHEDLLQCLLAAIEPVRRL